MDRFSRTELLIGKEGVCKLRASSVIVFGVGGVGSFTVEALARSGVGRIGIVDNDIVCLSNINRQLIAVMSTVGKSKTDVMKERILDINPACAVDVYPIFYGPETADTIDLADYDYVVDAIDTVSSKLLLIERSKALGVPVISSMGAGNKLDPTGFKVADVSDTSHCPLAKVMRKELRSRGIEGVKVVYSEEEAITPKEEEATVPKAEAAIALKDAEGSPGTGHRQIPGSIAYVPSVAGLIIAGEVIKDLTYGSEGQV